MIVGVTAPVVLVVGVIVTIPVDLDPSVQMIEIVEEGVVRTAAVAQKQILVLKRRQLRKK